MIRLPDVTGDLYGHRGSPLVKHEESTWKQPTALNNGPPTSGNLSGLHSDIISTTLRFDLSD